MRGAMVSWLAAAVLSSMPSTVHAACFPNIGCTDTESLRTDDLWRLACPQLRELRIIMKQEAGLCPRPTGRDPAPAFAACDRVDPAATTTLDARERRNVTLVSWMERRKRCPAPPVLELDAPQEAAFSTALKTRRKLPPMILPMARSE